MEVLSSCPVCGYSSFRSFLKCKDYFLSNNEFTIQCCEKCGMRFTNPRPDSSEALKYYDSNEYISHNAKKSDLIHIIYRQIRNVSIRRKYDLLKKYSIGNNLLDIGCGTGEFIAYCSTKGFTATGIEPSENARKYANDTLHQDVKPESFFDEIIPASFDIITLWHVLEHIHDLNEYVQEHAKA